MGYYVKELPENCAKCDCLRECGDFDTYVTKFCGINGLIIPDIYLYEKRVNFCPLRELPERKEGFGTDSLYLKGKIDGWNYCLDEILGE